MVRSGIDCKVETDSDRWPRIITMDKLILSLLVFSSVGFISCQYEQGTGGYQGTGNYQGTGGYQSAGGYHRNDRPPSNILLHKQALGQDGSFNYAFAADNGLRQGEVISPDGSRKGSYSYVDPNGKTVTLSYTAGKDGFRVVNGDHVPRAPDAQQQRPNPQYYQQQQQPQQYSQPAQQPQYSYYRPNPVPLEAYRSAPDAPAYRGNPTQYTGAQYEAAYRQAAQAPHQVRPVPQQQPYQYRIQESARERPSQYLSQQYNGEYQQEDPRKPHSFGNGYSFEFAG